MDKYNYSEGVGTFTDIGILADELLISGVNVSCGYYNEHTFKEICNISELNNCLNFIYDIIVSLNDKDTMYSIQPQKPYENYSNTNYGNYVYNDYPKDDYSLPCDYCTDQDCMHCKHTW